MRKPAWDPDAPVLTDEDLEKEILRYEPIMWDIAEKSRKEKVEYGFVLCWDKDKKTSFMNQGICKGKDCEVLLPRCQWPDQFATIHTHPKHGGWIPSPGDVLDSFRNDDAVFCVGSVGTATQKQRKDAYQCYVPTSNGEVVRKYADAMNNTDELKGMDIYVNMISEASWRPSKDTVFRAIFKMERK